MTYAEIGQLVTAITGFLLLCLTGYGLANLRYKVPGAVPFVALTLAGAIWSFGFAFEKSQTIAEGFMMAARIEYLGLAFIPPLWLFVALSWIAHPLARSWIFRGSVFAVSFSLLLIVVTNDWHHWWYRSIVPTGTIGFARFERGVLYPGFATLYLSTFVFSTVLLLVRRKRILLFRRKASIILIANFFPFLFAAAYQFGFRPGGLDPTLFSLIPAFATLGWGLFRHDLIRIVPIARETVVESMDQAVLVIDDEGKLVDHNAAARPHLEAFHRVLLAEKELQGEMTLLQEGIPKTFRYRRSPIVSQGHSQKASVVILTDITEEKRLLDELAHQASHDALTGLANRRHFEDQALGEITRAGRHGGTLALVMFDLDWFKDINDRFGHPSGDKVLRSIGVILGPRLRPYDLLARIGGEEFAVLMPEAQAVEAREAAERCRAALESTPQILPGAVRPVTASFGVATLSDLPIDISTDPRMRLDAMMVLADKALYKAKNEGRNRVV